MPNIKKKEFLVKKYFFLLIAILSILSLFSESAENKTEEERDFFSEYIENPNQNTFISGINEYYKDVSSNPDNFQLQIMIANLLKMEIDRIVENLTDNKSTIDNRIQFQLANLLLELKDYDLAINIYEKLNTDFPKWSCAFRHKGEAYFKKGELKNAEIALKDAIRTRIEHYDAYIMLADVQKEMGKYSEAYATFNTGMSYKGKDIEDPEEEISSLEESFLKLELLKLNNLEKEYQELKKHLLKIAPTDKRWVKFN